eukprot:1349699-Amorphochlora_amoeboformis.AAC.1
MSTQTRIKPEFQAILLAGGHICFIYLCDMRKDELFALRRVVGARVVIEIVLNAQTLLHSLLRCWKSHVSFAGEDREVFASGLQSSSHHISASYVGKYRAEGVHSGCHGAYGPAGRCLVVGMRGVSSFLNEKFECKIRCIIHKGPHILNCAYGNNPVYMHGI